MAERNYNLIEPGPRGTGKSYVYCETSPNSFLTSSGKTTVAQLFAYMGTGRIRLLDQLDVVAFDEVPGIQFADSTVVQIMKDFMESGSFARQGGAHRGASVIFLPSSSWNRVAIVGSSALMMASRSWPTARLRYRHP
jgi:ATP-dependent Lon protease